ncbi:hypothetical protein [Streptomyces sp. NPDC002640]
MTTAITQRTGAHHLVSPEFFARLSARVAAEHGLTVDHAQLITDQALAYLATSATKPAGAPTLYMSAAVDPAWHTFMTFTAEYDAFFASNGWRKVHHNPCDGFQGKTYPPAAEALPLTVETIRAAGFDVDEDLWRADMACGEDDNGDTCGDDGGTPNDCPGH